MRAERLSRKQLLTLGVLTAILAAIVDQVSKAAVVSHFAGLAYRREDVLPFFRLSLTENPGISFGLFGAGAGWGWLALSGVQFGLTVALIWALLRARTPLAAIGYGLIVGGAAGNLADRLRLGRVVDFLDVHFGSWTPFVFNGADAAITIGVLALLLDGLLGSDESPN